MSRSLPHELDWPPDTPKTIAAEQTRLRARITDAVMTSTDNRLTLDEQAPAIEAALCQLGFNATVSVRR
jgi:hypothetical protein